LRHEQRGEQSHRQLERRARPAMPRERPSPVRRSARRACAAWSAPKLESILATSVLAIVLAGCALSAPPPERGGAPLLTPQSAPADVPIELPSRRPSLVSGAAIYVEKCVACHGPSGRGDGEQAAQIQSNFGAAPSDLTADSVVRTSTPAEWFAVISGGRLESGMPPFQGSLSVDDRWDVVAYVWSLGAPEATLAAGQAVYSERCVQCHGAAGKGNGPESNGSIPDLSNLAAYQSVAPGEWDSALVNLHIPTFSGKLDGTQRAAVIDYMRSFVYDATTVAEPAPTATPGLEVSPGPQPASWLLVNGQIVNGTAGASVPAGLEVTLYRFPQGLSDNVVTQTLKADAAGRFAMQGLEAQASDVIAATITYAEVTYPSNLFTFDGANATADLQLTIYEPTTETATIHIDTLHVIITVQTDVIEVNEIYVISNPGDRVVLNLNGPALRFALPVGATAFRLLDGAADGAVATTAEGFGFYDAIPPGQQSVQLVVSYQLPLADNVTFNRTLNYPVAKVNVLLPSGDLEPSGDQLTDLGAQDIQGQLYRQFSSGPLQAGGALAFGLARPGAGIDAKLIGGIALLAVGAAVIGFGVMRSRRRQETLGQPDAHDRLLDEIAALDDDFEAGRIAETDYRRRRQALKTRALQSMRKS